MKTMKHVMGFDLDGRGVKSKKGVESKEISIVIPRIEIKQATIKIIGDSPLITHKWAFKTIKQLRDKHAKKAVQVKEARNPFNEFLESMYWLSEPEDFSNIKMSDLKKYKFGIPTSAFKGTAVNACSFVDGITKVIARGAFQVVGDFAELKSDPPVMRSDMARIARLTPQERYRGQFNNWSCNIVLRFNPLVLSAEQLINLFNVAGFHVGVLEMRPQGKTTSFGFGMFHVEL